MPKDDLHVAVIGAGLAGLTAAYELMKLDINVSVFEASERVGGRVLTLRRFEEPSLFAEAGAMVFTDAEPKIKELASELNVDVLERCEFSRKRFQWIETLSNEDPTADVMTLLMNKILALENEVIQQPEDWCLKNHPELEQLDRINIVDFLVSHGFDHDNAARLLSATLIGIYTNVLTDLSALDALRFLSQYAHCREMFSIKGGNEQLPLALANALNREKQTVFLNKPVSQVSSSTDNKWTLSFFNSEISQAFDFIIVAVPLSSLQSTTKSSITITDLPHKQLTAINQLSYNTSSSRVFCEVTSRFWSDEFITATVTTDKTTFWIEDHTSSQSGTHAVIEAHTGCDVGRQLQQTENANKLGEQLISSVYGSKFNEQLVSKTTTTVHWNSTMPYQNGSNTYWQPKQRMLLSEAIKPVKNTLFFSGEYTTYDKPFSMNGAVLSGYRVVTELTEEMKKASFADKQRRKLRPVV